MESSNLRHRILWIGYSLASLAYILLAFNLPVSIFTNAGHDDALFVKLGYSIASGNWLGLYNQLTLAKGAAFPLFLAANSLTGIPITITVAILYLCSCLFFCKKIKYLINNEFVIFSIFILILLHPSLFPIRIVRDNIYPALSLLVISILLEVLFCKKPLKKINLLTYGFLFFMFINIRDEWIWAIPGLLIIFFGKLYIDRTRSDAVIVTKNLFKIIIISLIFTSVVSMVNYARYGIFNTNDFSSGSFKDAVTAMTNVQSERAIPFVPVDKQKRELIYSVSPSFSRLKEYFEDKGRGWTVHGCSYYPWSCGDYAGGWFMWALRDGVAYIGEYNSAVNAASFYNAVKNEIAAACDDGRLTCQKSSIPFLPMIGKEQWLRFPSTFLSAVQLSLVNWVEVESQPSNDPLDRLARIRLFLRNPLTTMSLSERSYEMGGWYRSSVGDWLVLDCKDESGGYKKEVARLPSPDIADAFKLPGADYQRFSIINLKPECAVTSTKKLFKFSVQDLNGTSGKSVFLEGGNELHFDTVSTLDLNAIFRTPVMLKYKLSAFYKNIMPLLAIVGLLSFILYCVNLIFSRQRPNFLAFFVLGIYTMYLTRISLLTLIDISSFPAISPQYLSACFVLIVIASMSAFYLFFSNFRLCQKRVL